MLSDNVAALGKKSLGSVCLLCGGVPAVCYLYINLSVGIYGVNAHCKSVDTACALGVLNAHCGNVADEVGLGLHTCNDTGKISCLINSAEVVVEVSAVVLVACAVAEVNVGELSCQRLHLVHVAPACAEDDVAAFLDALTDSCFGCGRVAVAYVVLSYDLVISETKLLLHTYDTLIVSVCISGAVSRVADVDNADLYIVIGECLNSSCVSSVGACCVCACICCVVSG